MSRANTASATTIAEVLCNWRLGIFDVPVLDAAFDQFAGFGNVRGVSDFQAPYALAGKVGDPGFSPKRVREPPCRLGVGAKKTRRRYVCGLKNILLH
jgi:hypothetical protein